MGANPHHRASFAGATLNLRAEARFPSAVPLTATAPTQRLALRAVDFPRGNGPLTLGGRADCFYRPLVAPKWTRWGYFSADGVEFTPTRVL